MKQRSGFTIVELLIVIVVIGVLAALVLNSFTNAQAKARDAKRATDISAIKKSIEAYKAENGFYPSIGNDNAGYSAFGLASLISPQYIPSVPQDPTVGKRYDYVRGTVASDSYAILVPYEERGTCKTGNNVNTGWWGSSVPTC